VVVVRAGVTVVRAEVMAVLMVGIMMMRGYK
jgi:hypothetical protein